jgi:uncharacterized protein (DUF849 family)
MIPLLANPWVLLTAGLALAGAVGGAYIKGRSDGRAVEIAGRVTLEEVARTAREAAIAGAAEKIASIEVKHVTVRQQLETQIREKPVYRDCIADQRVLDTVNEAITGNTAAGSSELPAASADDGANVR